REAVGYEEVARTVVTESFGKDADDLTTLAVESHRAPHDRGIAAEAPVECRGREQRHRVAPLQIFGRGEQAAELRTNPKRREETRRRPGDGHALGAIAALQGSRSRVEGPRRLEGSRLPQIVELADRQRSLAAPDALEGPVDERETRLVAPA